MKKILLAIMLLTFTHAGVQSDKFQHAFVGVGIYGLCLITSGLIEDAGYDLHYDKAVMCLLPVAVAGAGKELYDSTKDNHNAEFADFAYTMAIPLSTSIILYKW